jgi:uncharacterized membrane protein YozB (DUF420 family)
LSKLLDRWSVLFCSSIVLFVLLAFWPSYFSRPFDQPDALVHIHALSQTGWCLLLTAQVYAIHRRSATLHKKIGAIAPVLVAVIGLSTVMLMHQGMQGLAIADHHLKVFAFNLTTLVAFLLLYGLAMYHRYDRRLHAGYMLSTAFVFFTAFVPRLLEDSPSLVGLSTATFGSFVALSQAGLIPADIAVAAMSVLDWRARQRPAIFPVVLACLLAIHVSPVALHALPMWRTVTEAFVGLPLVFNDGPAH